MDPGRTSSGEINGVHTANTNLGLSSVNPFFTGRHLLSASLGPSASSLSPHSPHRRLAQCTPTQNQNPLALSNIFYSLGVANFI
jgi:hypothetical protein